MIYNYDFINNNINKKWEDAAVNVTIKAYKEVLRRLLALIHNQVSKQRDCSWEKVGDRVTILVGWAS